MHFAITILGNNSAVPANGRHPTSQVVTVCDRLFLVDCGEGTQMQMSLYKIKRSKIDHIFISHLHGDHYFGLIGLLNSFGLQSRTAPLHIYGPAPLENILQMQFDCAQTELPYPLHFHSLKAGQNGILLKTKDVEISTFPTTHRIDCFGFLFKEQHLKRKIIPEKVKQFNIPFAYYRHLQDGEDYQGPSGQVIRNELLTETPPKERVYAFCADTLYDEKILTCIAHCDAMYHEATYLHAEVEKAGNRYHTTALQAARLAEKAGAGRLLLGHFSSKYTDLAPFEEEARAIFPNTTATKEGVTYLV